MIFQTTRLKIRKLCPADFPPFHEMHANPNVMRYTTGRPLSKKESRQSLKKCIASYSKPGNDFWVWAVERKSDGTFLGTSAIVENNEIGYRFLEKYWGNGYGQELTDGLVKYALEEMCKSQLIAYADTENVASVKILERSRLKFVKECPGESGKGVDRFYKLQK